MDASMLPEYHIEMTFDSIHSRPRGYSEAAKTMDRNSAQLLRDVMRPPGGLAFRPVEIDDYDPTPAQVIATRKVRFRHGAEPKHFPIAEIDEVE